jgi:hypothetical protein
VLCLQLSSDEEVHAKADAFVSSVIRDAGKGGGMCMLDHV